MVIYGNKTTLVILEIEATLDLFYLSEDNIWILQVTMLPGLIIGLILYSLILRFMWKKGLKEPIDKMYFFDFATVTLFMLGTLVANRFYLMVDHSDPGEIFCYLHRLCIYGIGNTHRLVGTMMALARRKFVCDSDNMLTEVQRNRFFQTLFLSGSLILAWFSVSSVSVFAFPEAEKSLVTYGYCRASPEITRQNFKDFYKPHQSSEYDFQMHLLSAYSQLMLVLVTMITEIICIIQTYSGMIKYLSKSKVLSEVAKTKRRKSNFISFKGFILLAILDLFSFCLGILGKREHIILHWIS